MTIKLTIVIGCVYFIYVRLTNNNQLKLIDFINEIKIKNFLNFKNCLVLILFSILNWILEIYKWQNLASHRSYINFKNATIQSLASLTTSLITPNRIGEYGAKALYFKKQDRKQILGLNLIGNFYQMMVTVIFGTVGFLFLISKYDIQIDYRRFIKIGTSLFLILMGLLWGAKKYKSKITPIKKTIAFIKSISTSLNIKTCLLATGRFIIFSHQFYLILLFLNTNINYIDTLAAISSIYIIASIIPMLSLFDVVLKGSIAIWLLSYLNVNPISALSATSIMWILNFAIPAIVGSYFVLNFKPKFN